jgi:hypothetical protein
VSTKSYTDLWSWSADGRMELNIAVGVGADTDMVARGKCMWTERRRYLRVPSIIRMKVVRSSYL